MHDTQGASLDRYVELLRSQTPEKKLAQVSALTNMVREMAKAGIRARFPGASPEEINVRLVVRLYGVETGRRLFGEIPPDAV